MGSDPQGENEAAGDSELSEDMVIIIWTFHDWAPGHPTPCPLRTLILSRHWKKTYLSECGVKQELLKQKANAAVVNAEDWTVIHKAAFYGQKAALEVLLKAPGCAQLIDARTRAGCTALMLASQQGRSKIKSLCRHPPDSGQFFVGQLTFKLGGQYKLFGQNG